MSAQANERGGGKTIFFWEGIDLALKEKRRQK